jgi:hypothetical protein
MDLYPRMLYRQPGGEELHGGRFATLVVANEADEAAALADGWSLTSDEAKAAREASLNAELQAQQAAADVAPPTRAELEQKASELGIKFDGRTSDKKLRDLIAATLEA